MPEFRIESLFSARIFRAAKFQQFRRQRRQKIQEMNAETPPAPEELADMLNCALGGGRLVDHEQQSRHFSFRRDHDALIERSERVTSEERQPDKATAGQGI